LFDTSPELWEKKREHAFNTVFSMQQRPLLIGLAIACMVFAWRKGPQILRLLFLIIGLTYTTMIGTGSWLPNWYYYWLFPIIVGVVIIWVSKFFEREGSKNHLFYPLVALLCLTMILFTSAHFIIGRYFLYLLPLIILGVMGLVYLATKNALWLRNGLLICLGLMLYHFANKADARLTAHDNLKYVDQITVMKRGITFLEEKDAFSRCVAATYIVGDAMKHPLQGYLSSERTFECINSRIMPETIYALSLNFDNDKGTVAQAAKDSTFTLIWETTEGKNFAKIFERKKR
ncbi:MAG: hypothetical protein QF371_06485, partial [Flavobacteriales bacterium]|nr:hypothetical protein [Flavobacteriales bacterium]